MKTECIYVDENRRERILYIDELVTIEYDHDEIHYMNNDSRLFREIRRASRERRLFCTTWTMQTQTAATTRAP